MDLNELAQKDILKYEDLVKVRRALDSKTPIVVTGMTASGKTTFIKALAKELESNKVAIFGSSKAIEYRSDLDFDAVAFFDVEAVQEFFVLALRLGTDFAIIDELNEKSSKDFVAKSKDVGLIAALHGTEERVKQLLPDGEEALVIELATTNDLTRYIKSVNLLKK